MSGLYFSYMYLQHFGLTSYPFSITPDADVIYYNDQYRDAYANLHYSVQHPGGIIVLTGEVGTGKTTLVRSFLSRQDASQVQAAYIFNPKQSVASLLANICQELGIKTGRHNNSKKLIDLLYEYLIEAFKNQQRILIIIDEAQHLDFDTLEHLRLVTNLEVGISKLVQVILVGQEELLIKLSHHELRQFNQRVVARFHLRRLNEQQLFDYVQHRLNTVNGSPSIIPRSLSHLLYRYTKGIPRLANILCDRALIGAYAKNRNRVDKKMLKKSAAELFIESTAIQSQNTNTAILAELQASATAEKNHRSISQVARTLTFSPSELFATIPDDGLKRFLSIPGQRLAIVALAILAGGWLWPTVHDYEPLILREQASEQTTSDPEDTSRPLAREQEPVNPIYRQPAVETVQEAEKDEALAVVHPIEDQLDITNDINRTAQSKPSEQNIVTQKPTTIATRLIDAAPIESLEEIQELSTSHQDYSSLLDIWGVDYSFSSNESPCLSVQYYQLTCVHIKADVDLIRRINLPTIIEWQPKENSKSNQTALLVGFDDSTAILFKGDTYFRIDNESLENSWKGYGHYFIRAPKDFRSAFQPESTSDSIIWLINALTEIDEKYSLQEVSKTYNGRLVQTVKTFQKQQGLPADGIVGLETLARLNHLLYQAPQLEHIK